MSHISHLYNKGAIELDRSMYFLSCNIPTSFSTFNKFFKTFNQVWQVESTHGLYQCWAEHHFGQNNVKILFKLNPIMVRSNKNTQDVIFACISNINHTCNNSIWQSLLKIANNQNFRYTLSYYDPPSYFLANIHFVCIEAR